MRTTLLAVAAALSLATVTAHATSDGVASLGNGDPFPVRAPMAQADAQEAANSSSGRVIQPSGVGDLRQALSPGQRQTFDRDFTSPAGIGCGLLCRAGIQ